MTTATTPAPGPDYGVTSLSPSGGPRKHPPTSVDDLAHEINNEQKQKLQPEIDVSFKHIRAQKLHPTFGAEITGVNFSAPISDEVLADIRAASAKVSCLLHPQTHRDHSTDDRHA